jgi:hypothetical protein
MYPSLGVLLLEALAGLSILPQVTRGSHSRVDRPQVQPFGPPKEKFSCASERGGASTICRTPSPPSPPSERSISRKNNCGWCGRGSMPPTPPRPLMHAEVLPLRLRKVAVPQGGQAGAGGAAATSKGGLIHSPNRLRGSTTGGIWPSTASSERRVA